ncbi:MAG: hypothetical protein V3T81_10260, partial [Thermoanaerobaculia bacterium]
MSRLPGVQRRDSLLRGWGTCALLASCALASCVGPLRVKVVDAPDAARVQTEQPFGSEGLSERTAQTLRVLDLERMLADNPVGAIAILDSIWRGREAQPALAAEAELLYLAAARVELQDPEMSAAWYLLAAARAFEYLFGRPSSAMERAFDSNFLEMRELYNRAVAAYVVQLDQSERGLRSHVRETAFETFRVRLDVDPTRVDPAQWDAVLVAADLEVKGLQNHYSRDGIGASLVTLRENRQSEPMDRFHPPEGIVNPATAVVTFEPRAKGQGDEVREATLAFFDPRQLGTLEVDRFKRVPLAADFTTPFAYLVSRSELLRGAQEGLLHPAEVQPRQGLYLMEPYDPEKIPLIMVHGLRSSPLAWMELTNDLFGDPVLRSRYQTWYYLYPTGLPFLYSGMVFRGSLELLRSALDPEGGDPAMGSMVIVAHSMGGLLTRTLVSDSGMRLWNAALRVPPEDLVATEGEVEWLREI